MVMSIATELMRFFHLDLSGKVKNQRLKTIADFCQLKPEWDETLDLAKVFMVCSKLAYYGYLVEAQSTHPHPILGRSYIAPNFSWRRADYGEYEFVGSGFSKIVRKLGPSVRPVSVTRVDGTTDIGTCFLLGNENTIVTARHVVEGMARVEILDLDGRPIKIQAIRASSDPELDVAIICTESRLSGLQPFRCDDYDILDEVVCLGYPPIPGFETMLVSDVANINTRLKASGGRLIGESKSYLDHQEYFLINARVKGGNSGGPLVNYRGHVIGILVQTSMDSKDMESLDSLGYGIATPFKEWVKILPNQDAGLTDGVEFPFENIADGGFRTNL